MNFYVYAHISTVSERIFYIGKGSGKRAWLRRGRNRRWFALAKNGYKVIMLAENLPEPDAFTLEIELIKVCGFDNLVNGTFGGEGGTPTIEARRNMSNAQTGRKHNETTKAKIAAAHRGMTYSAETRRKLSEFRQGSKASNETKARLSECLQGNRYRRDQTLRLFYHPLLGKLICDAHQFHCMTGEHPTKLIKGRKTHIKRWVYLGCVNRAMRANQRPS